MARKRMIDPNFWRDEKISELTCMERLLFIGLWTFADDEGRGRANPKLLMSDIFPYDSIKISDMNKSVERLNALNLIKIYQVDEQMYYSVNNFQKYQTINRPSPSIIPPPNEDSLNIHGGLTDYSLRAHGGLTEDSLPNISKDNIREDNISKENTRARYGEFKNVLLTAEEYEKLQSEYPDYQKKIDNLSEYMARTGKSYKSHYLTILNWARKDDKSDNIFLEMLKEERCKEQIL